MSEQEYHIEKCGGLTVYHPIKKQAEVIPFKSSWQLSLENKVREQLEAA